MPPPLVVPAPARRRTRVLTHILSPRGVAAVLAVALLASLLFVVLTPAALRGATRGVQARVALSLPATAPARATSTPRAIALPPTTTTLPPTTTTLPPTTTTLPPTTTTLPPTTVPPTTAPEPTLTPFASLGLVPEGRASAFGCRPALVYLALYAAPGYRFVCPGNAQGHQATTCAGNDPCSPGQRLIIIADPCPAAYMNEASNSWAILFGGVIDPFGSCPG